MRRPPSLALSMMLAAVATCALSGCSASDDPNELGSDAARGNLPGVRVSGPVGSKPSIKIKTPLKVDESSSRLLTRGKGAPIMLDQLFVLQLTIVDGRTGDTSISTYDEGQTALAVKESDENLFPVLTKALTGLRQGSRVVVQATADDAYGDAGAPQYRIKPGDPIVMVADVLSVPPTQVLGSPQGKALPRRKGMPSLVGGGTSMRLDFTAARRTKPRKLQVVPLVEGTGPPARANSLVTLDYLGQLWGTNKVVDETYSKEPATVALSTGRVIKAWDEALVGVRRGSRVLVLTPPSLAFKATGSPPSIPGNATLAYVIDVLGVS